MTIYDQLLAVQEHDTQLDQLAHRRAGLPERAQISEADQVLATVDTQIATQEATVAERRREYRRIEDALTTQEARAADINAKMYSGNISAARELQDLQSELETIRRHVSTIEDDNLAALEVLEEAEAKLRELASMREQILDRRSAAEAALTAAAAEIDAEADGVAAQRSGLAGDIPADVLDGYERLRGAMGGIAVAKLTGNRCEGCRLTLPAVEVDRIHRLSPDEPVYCDECGRLLVH